MSRSDHQLDRSRLWNDLKASFSEWSDDNAPQFAAAIAFYTILSLGPLLIFAILIAGTVFETEAARGEIVSSVEQYIGRGAAEMVQEVVQNASTREGGIWANILGFILLAFGASRIFQQLKIALNQILDVPHNEDGGITKTIMDRLLAIVAVMGFGLFLMASIIINAVLGRVGDALPIPGGSLLWQVVTQAVSLALIALVFALILRYLPDTDTPWRQVWEGAVFTAALFIIGQTLISLYLSRSSPGSSFGAAGPVIVVIVWIYYTTVIFFFGAEFMEVRSRGDAEFVERRRRARRENEVPEPAPSPSAQRKATAYPDPISSTGSASGTSKKTLVASTVGGGCAGILIGVGAAVLGLLIGSVRLVGRIVRLR